MFPPEITDSPLNDAGDFTQHREREGNWSTDHGQQQQWRPNSPPLSAVTLRRVQSDYTFDEIDLIRDNFDGRSGSLATSSASFDRVPVKDEDDDDLLASYMDLEKIEGAEIPIVVRDKFRRCRSVDDVKAREETCEVKKAMSPDKLAELWLLDPKRAKRILANRQSAARSKERKAQYMVELEKQVQSLQTEATSLSVQHSLFERDTNGLTRENIELRRELESLEQHAQLRDALIDALKQEIDRLKVATGDPTTSTTTDTFIMPIDNIPESQPQYPYDSSIPNHNHADLHRPKMSHLPSFDSLDSFVKTKKSRLNPPEPTLFNVKSQPSLTLTFDPNWLTFPQPSKVPSIYPLDNKSLYDSSKQKLPQFCFAETNIQTGDPTHHGLLTQNPFEPDFLSSGGQWAGPGRTEAVLDWTGLVPVGYWAV